MSNFSDWFRFDLRKSAAFDRYDEVESIMRERLAHDIQTQIRTQIDPGIRRDKGVVAEEVQVRTDGSRFVIYAESQAEVLRVTSKLMAQSNEQPVRARSIEDLFEPSSGVPTVRTKKDGSTSLVYREISLENIFNEQRRKAEENNVARTIEATVDSNLGRRYEEAFDEVEQRHPAE